MKDLRFLYEEAKKLSKVSKGTRKSMLKYLFQLESYKQLVVIIWFTEFELKTKEFKKFYRIIKQFYCVEDLMKTGCFSNLYLVYPKKQTIAVLSCSTMGLEIISKVYKHYNFLSTCDKIKLLGIFSEAGVNNVVLEKETNRIVYNGKLCEADIILKQSGTIDKDLIRRCSSTTIWRYLNEHFNEGLFVDLVYSLFEEQNYELLKIVTNKYKQNCLNLFNSSGETLESMAVCAFFHGNAQTDDKVFKFLEKSYDKSTEQLKQNLITLRNFKYPIFTSLSIKKYIKENIWVVEFLSKFLKFIGNFLPTDFLSILLEEDIDYNYFYSIVDSIGDKQTAPLVYKDCFFRVAMLSNRFKNFMLSVGFTLFDEKDCVKFISNHTKREDFEFYLNYLIFERKNDQYTKYLEIYKNNNLSKTTHLQHMKLYRYIKSIQSIIVEGEITLHTKDLENFFKNLFCAIENTEIEVFYENVIGLSLLDVFLIFIPEIYEIFPLYKHLINRFIDRLLTYNKTRKDTDVNKWIWHSLYSIPSLFVEHVDDFIAVEDKLLFCVIKNKQTGVGLKELERYENTPFKDIVITFIANNYNFDDIFESYYSKYEDERDFYNEIIFYKVKKQEYDSRILKLNESPWLDKILNEIFVFEKTEIFEMLERFKPEFLFDYSIRHKQMRIKYLNLIDPTKCSKEQAYEIYKILEAEKENIKFIFNENTDKTNLEFKCATYSLDELDRLEAPIITLLYLLSFIRPNDGKFFVYKNINFILNEIKITKKHRNEEEEKQYAILDFILSVHLTDKFFTYVVWDDLIDCLKTATQSGKYLLLKNFELLNISKNHIADFLNVITNLLHDTNTNICIEAKRILNNIVFCSPEMISLRSQLIQCLIDKIYVKPFFETLYVQTFNHFICLNSLTLLVQVLRLYIREYKEDVLFKISSFPIIVKPSDLSYIMPSVYNILSKFVIDCQFYTEEVVKTVFVLLKYSKNVDFTLLIQNIDKSLSVGCLLVKTLSLCDVSIQRGVIDRVINRTEGNFEIPNNFLAYAPELTVFNEYISHFIPLLKNMYESEDYDKRKIAFNAFERIEITDYLVQTTLLNDWGVRLNTLDLFFKKNEFSDKVMASIFILRHDPHSVVRKKAYDLWKMNVENPNKKLKTLYVWIFEYIRFIEGSCSLKDAINHTISEICTKYSKYVEEYITKYFIENDIFDFSSVDSRFVGAITYKFDENIVKLPFIDVIEVLLLECSRQKKFMDIVFKFSFQFISTKIYKALLNDSAYREKIIEIIKKNIQDSRLCELVEDPDLASDLYNSTGNISLLKNVTEVEKIKLIKTSLNDIERISDVFNNLEASLELEEFVLGCDVDVQYLYLTKIHNLNDFGSLHKLFTSVFIKKKNEELQNIIHIKNKNFILNVTFKNITNFDKIVCLILQTNTLIAIERLNEVIEYAGEEYLNSFSLADYKIFNNFKDKKNYQLLMGYLLYNNLYYENRAGVKQCVLKIQHFIGPCEFDELLDRVVFI